MKVSFSWLYTKANIIHKKWIKMLNVYLHQPLLAFLGNTTLNLEQYNGHNNKNEETYAPIVIDEIALYSQGID